MSLTLHTHVLVPRTMPNTGARSMHTQTDKTDMHGKLRHLMCALCFAAISQRLLKAEAK